MSTKFIFFGNGPLAEATLNQLLTAENLELVFHAKTKDDLAEVTRLKQKNPEIKGILASFGVLIKSDLLELFEPEGILNLHLSPPSLSWSLAYRIRHSKWRSRFFCLYYEVG